MKMQYFRTQYVYYKKYTVFIKFDKLFNKKMIKLSLMNNYLGTKRYKGKQ